MGCAYPQFAFVPETEPAEVVDSAVAETAVVDSMMVVDTTPEIATDTRVADVPPCPGGCSISESCVASVCRPFASCRALHAGSPALASGAYTIDPDGTGPLAPFAAFCEMVEDGGGWTLAMKIDGAKKTFTYNAALWTNDATLNPLSNAMDATEAKLTPFSTIEFTKLRIGMQLATTRRFIVLDVAGASLREVFNGPPITTTAGRAEWRKLLPDPQLQSKCGAEGINQDFTPVTSFSSRARIGILGNNEDDCASPDSYIGFGAGFIEPHSCVGAEPGIVVGNYNPLSCGGSAGLERSTTGFGYVFVR